MFDLIDYKGDFWRLLWSGTIVPYLYKGEKYYKSWWYVLQGPKELQNYNEIPLPIFTDWWPDV